MSETLHGKIEQVEMQGPLTVKKEGKNQGKKFHVHILKVGGVELKQFDFRGEPKAPAKLGDNVSIIYSTITNSKGQETNTIQELEVLEKGITTQSLGTPAPKLTTPTPFTNITNKTYNNTTGSVNGARVGGVLHDAVALAIAVHGENVKLTEVEQIASDLLVIAARLEN